MRITVARFPFFQTGARLFVSLAESYDCARYKHWFWTYDDAKSKVEDWRKHYKEDGPREAIGN